MSDNFKFDENDFKFENDGIKNEIEGWAEIKSAEYAKYCIKSLFVQKQIPYKEDNFPRILDSYLQGKARSSARPNEDTED